MYEIIKAAIESLSVPLFYVTRGTNNVECIVYNYISTPSLYTDNTLKGTEYKILLNVYSKTDVEKTKKNVLMAMRSSGFKGGRAQATLLEDSTLGLYNTAISFNYYIAE